MFENKPNLLVICCIFCCCVECSNDRQSVACSPVTTSVEGCVLTVGLFAWVGWKLYPIFCLHVQHFAQCCWEKHSHDMTKAETGSFQWVCWYFAEAVQRTSMGHFLSLMMGQHWDSLDHGLLGWDTSSEKIKQATAMKKKKGCFLDEKDKWKDFLVLNKPGTSIKNKNNDL